MENKSNFSGDTYLINENELYEYLDLLVANNGGEANLEDVNFNFVFGVK